MHRLPQLTAVVFFGVSLLASALTSQVKAAIITLTTADGQGADARIRGGTLANNNYGTESFVAVRFPPVNASQFANSRKTYLRFDLSTLGALVTGVQLELTTTAGFQITNTLTFDVYGLNDGDSGESWAETGITWNNAPQNNTGSTGGANAFLNALPCSDPPCSREASAMARHSRFRIRRRQVSSMQIPTTS